MENGSLANRSKIMDHTLDAAIITRNGPLPPGIGHVTLRHVNICLYLSVMHPLAEKDTVTTDDLDQSSDIVKRTVPGLLPAEIDLIWKSSRHLSPHLKNLITAARNI